MLNAVPNIRRCFLPVLSLSWLVSTVGANPGLVTTESLLEGDLPASLQVASLTSGVITLNDFLIHASHRNWAYSNPLDVAIRAGRSDVREDAAYFVAYGITEMVRVRHYAQLAREGGMKVLPDELAKAREKQDSCVEFTERRIIADQISTVPVSKYYGLYSEILPTLTSPEKREVAYIFQEVKDGEPGRGDAEVRTKMEALRASITRGDISVFDAAEKHSEAGSAKNKGRIGFVQRDSGYSPRFLELVLATPAKTLSPVVRIGRGYYLVWVDGIVPERTESMVQAELNAAILAKFLERDFENRVSDAWRRFPSSRSPGEALLKVQREENRLDSICVGVSRSYEELALADAYLTRLRENQLQPSLQELKDFYRDNPWLGRVDGFWKLSRVRTLGGIGQPYPSTEAAREALGRLRDALTSGTPADQLQERFPGLKFEVESTGAWVRSTNNGPADRELNTLPVGGVTRITTTPGEAVLFIKTDQREVPTRPFEEARMRVAEYLAGEKLRLFLKDDAIRLSKKYGLQHLWLDYVPRDTRSVAQRMIEVGL